MEIYLEFSGDEVVDKSLEGSLVLDNLGRLVLGHVLLELDDPNVGDVGLLHAEELEDPLVLLLVGVDVDEEDLVADGLGDLAAGLDECLGVAVALADEDEDVGLDLAAEDLLGRVLVELDDEREGVGLDELGHGLG